MRTSQQLKMKKTGEPGNLGRSNSRSTTVFPPPSKGKQLKSRYREIVSSSDDDSCPIPPVPPCKILLSRLINLSFTCNELCVYFNVLFLKINWALLEYRPKKGGMVGMHYHRAPCLNFLIQIPMRNQMIALTITHLQVIFRLLDSYLINTTINYSPFSFLNKRHIKVHYIYSSTCFCKSKK